MTLEELLAKVYKLKDGRKEDDIGMSEEYWKALGEFRVAHAREGHRLVDSAKAKEIAFGSGKIETVIEEQEITEETPKVRTTEEQLADLLEGK